MSSDYYLVRRVLTIPRILKELGVDLSKRRIYHVLGDFTVYLNQRRFKVIRLERNNIEAIVIGKHGEYRVIVNLNENSFYFSCPHHIFRKALCKHTLLVLELYIFLRNEEKDLEKVKEFLKENLEKLI